jgi:hypothetical protein
MEKLWFNATDEKGNKWKVLIEPESIIMGEKDEPGQGFKAGDWLIGKWVNAIPFKMNEYDHGVEYDCRLAREKEIKAYLEKTAREKGFKEGVIYYDPDNGQKCKVHDSFHYYFNGDMLTDGYGGCIYHNDKWGEIIPQKKKSLPRTKDELAMFLNSFLRYDNTIPNFLEDYED